MDQTLELARILYTSKVLHFRDGEQRILQPSDAMRDQFPKANMHDAINRANTAFNLLYAS